MLVELKTFLEESELALRAGASIRNGRQIQVVLIDETDTEHIYTFSKSGTKNCFHKEPASNPDVTLTGPEQVARDIATGYFENIGQVGLHIFEKMLSNDPKQQIRVKVHVGFLELVTAGYLGVVAAGGADVARFLAGIGLTNLGKIREHLNRLR